MLHQLAKYIEPAIMALIIIVCLVELIKVKSIAEIRSEEEGRHRILWLILPFILLAMMVVKFVWFGFY